MKTAFKPEEITQHLGIAHVEQLTEGHLSQAFRFESENGDQLVLRIADKDTDFKADQYAYSHFGGDLHVPKIVDLGKFGESAYYCISEFVEGKTSNLLDVAELEDALLEIQKALADTFRCDISQRTGYGGVNTETGNASGISWQGHLREELEKTGIEGFRAHGMSIGLDETLVDGFYHQFNSNLPYASEVRRLIHGDPSFDNIIVKDGKVVAIIDWAQVGYGDWMSDFARLDFWWPDRHGDDADFAEKFQLDAVHLKERRALYFATNALWTIEYADKSKHAGVTQWLHDYLPGKLA